MDNIDSGEITDTYFTVDSLNKYRQNVYDDKRELKIRQWLDKGNKLGLALNIPYSEFKSVYDAYLPGRTIVDNTEFKNEFETQLKNIGITKYGEKKYVVA